MKIAISNNNEIYSIPDKHIEKDVNEYITKSINELNSKERLMKAKSLVLIEKSTKKVIFELSMIHNQHFYPLSILDYANIMLKKMKNEISNFPIMSLDSHDYNFCDFNCKDCLAVDTRNWAKKNLNFTNFDIDHYKKVLKEIARYSKQRGLDSIRFEMSGEGNPDMYPHRAELIKYAKEECNMKCVYISSGSRLDEETIDVLAKYAYYIRISFPGVCNDAYRKYSVQKNQNQEFTYDDAINLIKKLVEKRKKYGREGELMIGARTCMRPENVGEYINTAKKLGSIGADSFQIVKILVPAGEEIEKYKLTDDAILELEKLNKEYKDYGLMHIQIPNKLDYMYYDRKLEDSYKPSMCYRSLLSPILYGPNLVICTHWEKIKDIKDSHYGKMLGVPNELEEMIDGENGTRIRNCVPEKCSSCCSIYDNQIMDLIRAELSILNDLDDVEFMLTY